MGMFFWVAKFQIFFGVLEILDILGVKGVDAGSEPTYAEKLRAPLRSRVETHMV